MSKNLIIVFVKNAVLGKVKTRLAKTIGNKKALAVYEQLLGVTEKAVNQVGVYKYIYFSEEIEQENWRGTDKFVQKGGDLGEKMENAFNNGFENGFEKIILIGSDLPDLSADIIWQGFRELDSNEFVLGPAEDGGYYLIGMNKPKYCVFKNKNWSTESLLKQTLSELTDKRIKYSLLETLNDIDTFEDLKTSKIYNDEKLHFNI